MSKGSKEQGAVNAKRSRKKQGQGEVVVKAEENTEFQKQGMAVGWQVFYARVREAVHE